jgi:hypothetical protein
VLAKDIVVGAEYGFRQKAVPGSELEHVRVLEKVRAQWRVEWVEPNPGLTDFVKSAQLVVPWKQRRAFLRDEENWRRIREASEVGWPGHEHPVTDAVDEVLLATGEDLATGNSGVLSADPGAIQRVCDRATISVPTPLVAYRDSSGSVHLPFESALVIAQAFAAAEPATVLASVESAAHDDEATLRDPYSRSVLLSLMNQRRAAYALVRQWAGHDAALADRDKEIDRLQGLIHRAVWELRRSDTKPLRVAARLERGLQGR